MSFWVAARLKRLILMATGSVLWTLSTESVSTAQPIGRVDEGTARPPIRVLARPGSPPPASISPTRMQKAYGFANIANQGSGQTIAIIAAFDHPQIESDLAVFNSHFGLPACTTNNGCFEKVYASGTQPRTEPLWAAEIALDVQWAHAMAPQARILLVEAASPYMADLIVAVDVAVQRGARVVSMSFGSAEFKGEVQYDAHFKVPGVTFVAASGDGGYGVLYPAASPHVLAVGGTTLTTTSDGTYVSEVAWNNSGGGFSEYEAEPAFQTGVQQTGRRSVPDVSYNAGTEILIYNSIPGPAGPGWVLVQGTSAGTPQWAAIFSIVNSLRSGAGLPPVGNALLAIYSTNLMRDITTGPQRGCRSGCGAVPGYDTVTGLGTPIVDLLANFLASPPASFIYSYLSHGDGPGRESLALTGDTCNGCRFSVGMSFAPASFYGPVQLTRFLLSKVGDPSDGVVLKIYSTENGTQRGNLLASSNVTVGASLNQEPDWYNGCVAFEANNSDITENCFTAAFTFAVPFTFQLGQRYLILFERTGSPSFENYYFLSGRTASDFVSDLENREVRCDMGGTCETRPFPSPVPIYTIWK
jgi:subtilase family serine protease